MKSDRGQAVNQVVLMTATIASMYNELSWPALGTALADAESGDGTALLALADAYNGRRDDGTYETIFQANPVISCASGLAAARPARSAPCSSPSSRLPHRGSHVASASRDMRDTCLDFLAQNPLPTIPSYAGTAPVLVVGGLNDPATPFRWAEEMTAMMGPSAVLLTFTGEGHGQVLSSTCVTEIEGTVLTEHAAAAAGRLLRPRPDVPRPAFWDQIPVPPASARSSTTRRSTSSLGLPPTEMYADVWFLTGDPRPSKRPTSRRSRASASTCSRRHDGAGWRDRASEPRSGQHRGARRDHPAGGAGRGRRLRRSRRRSRPTVRVS